MKYWCKVGTIFGKAFLVEIYEDKDFYRVYENRKKPGIVFSSLEEIKKHYPSLLWSEKDRMMIKEINKI